MDEEMEDSIVASTEINGNHVGSTIEPTETSVHTGLKPGFLPRKGQLPILRHGEPARAAPSIRSMMDFPSAASSVAEDEESSTDSEFDEMGAAHLAPPTSKVEVRIPPAPRFPPLPYSSSKTGLVYDARMRFHSEPLSSMLMENDIHPEDPRRIHEIFNEIQQAGLVQGPEDSEEDAQQEQCWRIHARMASRGEICMIHTPEHYEFIESLQRKWTHLTASTMC
jgi:histone deacetylase 6